jgi:O-antigen/teichoic acid export membrane protein
VEQLLVIALSGAQEAGYFLAALQVVQVLNSTIATSICAGALPSLTREALLAKPAGAATAGSGAAVDPGPAPDAVRRRTAATLAFAAVPAAMGLALVAPAVTDLVNGPAYAPSAGTLAILALGLVPLFANSLVTHALIAAEQARRLPRLTAVRVALAALLAAVLVPRWGGPGAAVGFVLSEIVLVALGTRAVRAVGFGVGVARPLLLAALASLPMAALVLPVRDRLLLALPLGAAAFAAALALLARSKRVRLELGYP